MWSQRDGGLSATTQVKVSSPVMFVVAAGPRISLSGSQQHGTQFGEGVAPGRGLSPWQVNQRFASELGRAVPLPTEASNKPKRQGGRMAVWQSDQLILEV